MIQRHPAVRFVLVAVALVLLAGCSSGDDTSTPPPSPTIQPEGSPPALSPSASPIPELPKAAMKQPFRNGPFEIVVSRVQSGVLVLPVDTKDLRPDKAENGQFILVHLSAKNAGNQPESMSYTSSTLIDDQGKQYTSNYALYHNAGGQGLDQTQQPGTSATGYLIFDVPAGVKPAAVWVQPDAEIGTENLPTVVALA